MDLEKPNKNAQRGIGGGGASPGGDGARSTSIRRRPGRCRVAVIGAGLAGARCARTLRDSGVDVLLLDKGHRPGGRLSTRIADDLTFDYGAQYWTARTDGFREWNEALILEERAARWPLEAAVIRAGGVTLKDDNPTRYVGVPGNAALVASVSEGLPALYDCRAVQIERAHDGAWSVMDQRGNSYGPFDALAVAIPPPQAAALARGQSPLSAQLSEIAMAPCWALMLAFDERIEGLPDAAFVEDSPIAWVSRDNARPGRAPGERWIVHAAADWSRLHVEDDEAAVARALINAFRADIAPAPEPTFQRAHRWRFAKTGEPLAAGCLTDDDRGLTFCGDWCAGDRVEGAWTSGLAAAAAVLQQFKIPRG